MSANIKQTFYDWCVENNRQDILDLWDYELNAKTPKEIGSHTNKKCWFKCPRGLHKSELQTIACFYQTPTMQIYCSTCNSIAQYLIDTYGERGFRDRWSDKNIVDPWTINKSSKDKVWINCMDDARHTYDQYVFNIYKGVGCPYCSGRRVLPEDSVGALYPDILKIWSDKNKKSPYEYTPSSSIKVWVKCLNGKHKDYLRAVKEIVKGKCGCSKCSRYSTGYPADLTGIRFGKLIVVREDEVSENARQRWLCLCDCQKGKEQPYLKSIDRGHLTTEKTISCGCFVREATAGENNWNWKGGISTENDKIRQSIEYRKWQNTVHKRDKYTCQCCGKRYKHLSVHHIFPFSDFIDLRLNVDNGICLCKDCHDSRIEGAFHNIYGTMHNTPEQLREYILNKSHIDIYETHPKILQLIKTQQND